jgi:hypothetical protein
MIETSGSHEALLVLFGISWLVLFYLAWPRLLSGGRSLWRKRSRGQPVRLSIPPLQPTWDQQLDRALGRAGALFLGLSLVELALRRPQWARYSLPLFALCFGLRMWLRRRRHGAGRLESAIIFPQVMDDTALGMGLLKAQDLLQKLRHIGHELDRKPGAFKAVAAPLQEFVESVRLFLVSTRLEAADSSVLRQARPLFIRLETLVDFFELLAQLSNEAELRRVSEEAITVLTHAKGGFEAVRTAQGARLSERVDILIRVLRQIYKPLS